MMTPNVHPIDYDHLLKLRLLVARYGEMDAARWWNTRGLLGRHGRIVLRRGLPKTHSFAQARVVFEVARSRCVEIFNPPEGMTLWNLPVEIEDQFDEAWHKWLDESGEWEPFFSQLESSSKDDLLGVLQAFELITPVQIETVEELRRSAGGRAVPLPGVHTPGDEVFTLLAAGFSKGEPGSPAIPYARLETTP